VPFVNFHRIPSLDDDLNDILETLQLLTALAKASPGEAPSDEDEDDLMRGIYIVEYTLLNLLTDEAVEGRGSVFYLREAVVLAFGLYMYLGLREIPRTAIILKMMVKRLRTSLEANQTLGQLDMLDPSLRLWMASLAVIAARDREERSVFVVEVEESSARLGLQSTEEKSEVLKSIVWTEKVGELEKKGLGRRRGHRVS
jgi:hypothetical protein